MSIKPSVRIVFGAFLAIFLATGITGICTGIIFNYTNPTSRYSTIVDQEVISFLLTIGSLILIFSGVGLIGVTSPLSRKRWIQVYTWSISIAILAETCAGLWLWSRTLDYNDMYGKRWRNKWSDEVRQSFQETYQCCGFLNPQDRPSQSMTCQSEYGCYYSVIHYMQVALAYIYTGLFVCVLLSAGSLLSALALLVSCNDEERLKWTRVHAIFRSHQNSPKHWYFSMLNPD